MPVTTRVRGILSVAHHNDRGRLHGHSYEVWATWPAGGDAVELQERLAAVLRRYDHRGLGANERSGEQLAELIGSALADCVQVDVSRPLEGIGARWDRG